ncbi:MAG: MoaD/ThiS family protein [Sediminimonas sp.]|uniref:MoaD/ThiS family protein n=1 Tax=Sediminimonas qiaohouensis TaxID=552061 RepID=A0A7C9LQW6_9RHOB|nr:MULTISPECIES: MoaD/ThiS family protein [Sediminimonas]MDR9486062.1 MoaD/ThiS family protein [Sediminimonas sp.]MTJ05880.1 MoaD/ThiS family protein [Sediminimonas qiaohouensis]
MVEVNLWSGLRPLADDKEIVEVEAETVGGLLEELVKQHPGLQDAIDEGVSVAVDGRIIASALDEQIKPDSEVFLMQRLKGG